MDVFFRVFFFCGGEGEEGSKYREVVPFFFFFSRPRQRDWCERTDLCFGFFELLIVLAVSLLEKGCLSMWFCGLHVFGLLEGGKGGRGAVTCWWTDPAR